MTLRERVDRWLERHRPTIESWEGVITDDLDEWLPTYNRGVYIVGEYHESCADECVGCAVTPFGFRTCIPRVKIGRASDVYVRIANLRNASSRALDVLCLMPFRDPIVAERELHQLFAEQRIDCGRKTEWFWNCEEISDVIDEAVSYGGEYAGH